LSESGLDGTIGCPDQGRPFPGVLALGGSGGGVPDGYLDLLVPEGFACLALAYFGTSATQPALIEVPLERVERGLRWLIAHPRVATQDGRVALIGRLVVERMGRHGRAGAVNHLNYPEAGHVLFPYKDPSPHGVTVPMAFDLGGSSEAATAADTSAWTQVVDHLRGAKRE
jgi:hypothetical protein